MTIEEIVEIIPALRAEIAALKAQLERTTSECVYCGRRFPADDPGQLDHWRDCAKHPARAELQRLSEINRLYHNQIVLMQQAEGEL
jgi:hypothetical protein